MSTVHLSNALMLAEAPSGKDIGDGFKAASELPGSYATAGFIGVIVGLAAGAGISSYCVDKGWGNPGALGFLYWGLCCAAGVFLVLVVSSYM